MPRKRARVTKRTKQIILVPVVYKNKKTGKKFVKAQTFKSATAMKRAYRGLKSKRGFVKMGRATTWKQTKR